ncbi:hypothetical protein Pcinc_044234 [Petrolisthes cinctipes]|uniref:Uncharacterized protein n=1 Tax=Petrolisthes cinctipes TaxID=88211 RepID=A0AAE1EH45_PETCI|nr:hypothetical protein Pcinc_044234 [Petrolisthes cinctipes]
MSSVKSELRAGQYKWALVGGPAAAHIEGERPYSPRPLTWWRAAGDGRVQVVVAGDMWWWQGTGDGGRGEIHAPQLPTTPLTHTTSSSREQQL